MDIHATDSIEFKSWDEQPYSEVEGGQKLARASVTSAFHGAIEGEGTLEYLLAYREDGSCSFVGFQRVVGRVDGRTGSFVLQHSGIFEAGAATATWTVTPGSGAGELRGLRGEGGFVSKHDEYPNAPYRFTYSFE